MTEAEIGVIGAVLVDSDALFNVYNKLKPEMISNEFCRDTYEAMLKMYDIGKDITLVTLSQELEYKYERELILGNLRTCFEQAPNSTEIKGYAQTIINEYKSRTLEEMFKMADLSPRKVDETIASILTRLEALQGNSEIKSKELKQIIDECSDKYFNDTVGVNMVRTGFYHLDDCLGGLEGGDVTVIGARPAVGKSAFVTQMIAQMAKKGKRVGYFNLEMNDSQIYERMLAKESAIELQRIRRAKAFIGSEKARFDEANAEMRKFDVTISSGGKSVSEIRAESRHQKYDVIVIDYLQLIKADRRYANRASEVGDISKAIKSLAMELHVPIVLLSQLNRTSAHTEDREPDMAELRESGDIEQDASNIILLWNLSSESHVFKGLKIEKQRQGEHLKEALIFDGMHMNFTEVDDDFKKFKQGVKNTDMKTIDDILNDSDDFPFG